MQNRRRFLQNTAYGALGAWITEQALGKMAAAPAHSVYTFFTLPQASTMEAITERIWPSSSEDPGAVEAGVVIFIDRSLSGFHHRLKPTYRRGIDSTNALARAKFGDSFPALSAEQQDEILSAMEKETSEAQGFFASPSSSEFFELLLTHTRQGLFSDPAYGGNRDFIGWKSIGYPGPRFLYTAEMQTTFAPLGLPLRSLADM